MVILGIVAQTTTIQWQEVEQLFVVNAIIKFNDMGKKLKNKPKKKESAGSIMAEIMCFGGSSERHERFTKAMNKQLKPLRHGKD